MQIRQKLEARGVSQWGEPQYGDMIRISEAADRHLLDKNYAAAAAKYDQALTRAKTLADQMDPVFKQLLDEGQMAFDGGNSEIAQQKFSIALLIQPDNRVAQHGLQRAKNLDVVMQLLESGNLHEKTGEIDLAQADYKKAVNLDPDAKEAKQALARVNNQIRDRQFKVLMSEGLTAFHNKEYQVARTKLLKAKKLRPESREVQDALAQVDQSLRLARIETYRQVAIAAEKVEDWGQALDAYLKVLKIDANVQFATQGQKRALKRIRIEKRINFFLQKPSVLASDRQLNNAIALISEIDEINPKGPQLKDRFEQLVRMVEAAQRPVEIIIESDTNTDVAVYKIGKLGRFESRQLKLRPGTYTVVGTRDGYQDVRREIIIKPGQDLIRVIVKCEVKL